MLMCGPGVRRLRGKGGFVVSARWDSEARRLGGPVAVHSEAGLRCRILLPPTATAAVRLVLDLSSLLFAAPSLCSSLLLLSAPGCSSLLSAPVCSSLLDVRSSLLSRW